jgi:SAM-dependent methyltransferase
MAVRDGASGWDDYAAFYDWENARTLGRRDVPFWRRLARQVDGPVLELGCGTGRILAPLARGGASIVGIDRSEPMLAFARRRLRRSRTSAGGSIVRGDIRRLPFRSRSFGLVMAPYGMVQSLTRERDLRETLEAVARVSRTGALFGIDMVPDLPRWAEYQDRVTLRGRDRSGATISLRETVRQDPRRGLTTFDQEYTRRRGGKGESRHFSLTFRTLSVEQVASRVQKAGFDVEAVLGDYAGGAWDPRADVWIILARRC